MKMEQTHVGTEKNSLIKTISSSKNGLDTFYINESKFIGQMIGSTPGLEAEELNNFSKEINNIINNIDFERPSEMVSNFFKIDFYVDWIRDAIYCELEKKEEDQLKNTELKIQLGIVIKNLVDSLSEILETKKIGYLLELIIQKDINILLRTSHISKINIPNDTIDNALSGNFSMEASILAGIPSYRDVSFTNRTFVEKEDIFKIERNLVYREDGNGKKIPIEEIPEYTSINPKLVTSENIINLVAFDGFLSDNFSLPVLEISLKEKLYLYNYLLTNNLYQLHKFVLTYNKQGRDINFFRTFLSIEHGGKEMGNKILALGEKLPENVAKEIFKKYGEIIDVVDKIEEEVQNLYEKENIPEKIFPRVREVLLKRGAHFLANLSTEAKEQELYEEIEKIKISTIIMGSSYVELYRQSIKIPLEDIENIYTEKIPVQNLSEKDKKELQEVYINGRPKETYKNIEHVRLLENEFKEALEKKDTFVFNIRFEDKIIAFATFYKENEDTFHIGGLTFIEDVRNPAIGYAVMNSIMNEFKNFNIKAEVHNENEVLKMYQKRFGFKIIKEFKDAGELYYEIERKKNLSFDNINIRPAA
jgi:ribosomal protein S18 acetylase RimI-like enzyme